MDDETIRTSPVTSSSVDDNLDSTILISIVIGCTGLLLMILGGVYYLSRLGDIPSRKSVAATDDDLNDPELGGGGQGVVGSPSKTMSGSSPSKSPTRAILDEEEDTATENGSSKNSSKATTATATREELIEIFAPAGKLGVILDSPTPGRSPVVHEIRPTSVLRDELRVGDRVIALDDEDVRAMTANKVSKLISQKMENSTRKFSILRTVQVPIQQQQSSSMPNQQ